MSKTKTTATKAKTSKATKKSKPAGKPADAKSKKLSAIDSKEMIEAMAAKKLWTSPGGKTLTAMLYSAIIREIAVNGKEARC